MRQIDNIDVEETFAPVVKPSTIWLILSIVVSKGWNLQQLDMSNAFLYGILNEDIFMLQPPGFLDKDHPDHVCRLQRSLYGLK